MEKKESYIVIDGVRYDAVKREGGTLGLCQGCVFDGCTLPKIDGFSIDCGEDTIFVSRGEVAAQQQLTERSEKDVDRDEPITFKIKTPGQPFESVASRTVHTGQYAEFIADKVKRSGAIGKRSCYSFPNGVEAEDICRYLPFNLGNFVRPCTAFELKKK